MWQDKTTHKEKLNPYYQLSQKEEVCDRILAEFGLPDHGAHIINGHVPVKIKDGETPVKANRQAVCHRRRPVQSIPEPYGHRGLYPDIQLQASGAC